MVSRNVLPIQTEGGHRFEVTLFDPDTASGPVCLVWPAMGTLARSYHLFAERLAETGLTVAVAELRGHGSSSLRPGHRCNFGFREMVQDDYDTVVNQLRARYQERAVYLVGHSLGGQLSLLYASANPSRVDGVVLIASCSTYYRSYGLRGLVLLGLLWLVPPLVWAVGYFPGTRLGFARQEGARVARDWAAQGRTGHYRPIGDPTPYEALMAELRLPVLVLDVKHDVLATPPAVSHLIARLRSAAITRHMVEVPESRRGFEHFDWFRHPQPVVEHVRSWLHQHRQV